MRYTARETDVALPAEGSGSTICRNIRKTPLEPDIELIVRVTVVGKRIVRRQADHHFERTAFRVTAQHGQLGTRRDTFGLEGLPDQLIKVNNGLVRSEGKGLIVGPGCVL